MNSLYARSLSSVVDQATALDFINNPANRRELCAAGRIPFAGEDAFQNACLRLIQNPYDSTRGAFSTYWHNCARGGKTADQRASESDGTSADQYTCRGSSGSGDDAKSRVLEDGRPTPRIPDLGEDLALEKILESATETESEVIFLLTEGRTIRQIAGLLNMGESSVRQRIQYARERAGFKRAKAC